MKPVYIPVGLNTTKDDVVIKLKESVNQCGTQDRDLKNS